MIIVEFFVASRNRALLSPSNKICKFSPVAKTISSPLPVSSVTLSPLLVIISLPAPPEI